MTDTVLTLAKLFLLEPLLSLALPAVWSLFFFWLRGYYFANWLVLLSSGGNILNGVRLFLYRVWLLNLDVCILSLNESCSGLRDLLNLHFLGKLD